MTPSRAARWWLFVWLAHAFGAGFVWWGGDAGFVGGLTGVERASHAAALHGIWRSGWLCWLAVDCSLLPAFRALFRVCPLSNATPGRHVLLPLATAGVLIDVVANSYYASPWYFSAVPQLSDAICRLISYTTTNGLLTLTFALLSAQLYQSGHLSRCAYRFGYVAWFGGLGLALAGLWPTRINAQWCAALLTVGLLTWIAQLIRQIWGARETVSTR